MRIQFLLIILLTFSIGTALFTGSQVAYFFSPRSVQLTALGNEASGLDYSLFSAESSSAELRPSEGSVMGVATSDLQGLAGSQATQAPSTRASVISHKGHLYNMYFRANNSPLAGYGQYFVDACERYDAPADCTLLPAIAKIETDHCKTDISASQFNCWGFGGSGANRILYSSFPEAIDEITRRLMVGYGERFFRNANNGGLYYCGRHCVNWGNHVESEKRNINTFFQNNGHPALF